MALSQVPILEALGGDLVRFGDGGGDGGPDPVPPSAPTSVTASATTANAVKLSWGAPARDGGSPVTGYTVSINGGTPIPLPATATTYTFGGLAPLTNYTVVVLALNIAGAGTAASRTVKTPSSIVTGERFPGDPNPLKNKRLFHGMSSDNASGYTSLSAFENAIGGPVGVHHYFDNGIGIPSIAVPDATHPTRLGVIPATAKTDLAAGRLPLASTHIPGSLWKAAGNGTFDATGKWTPDPAGGIYDDLIYAFIDWCEGYTGTVRNLSGPLWWVCTHEPEAGAGGPDGPSTDYRSMMNRIRWVINKWEAANGKRKRFVFLTVHTASMWAGNRGGTAAWWPGDNVPDVVGVDCYAEHSATTWSVTDSVIKSGNFLKFHKFVTDRNLPWALTEYGTLPANTNGFGVLKEAYDYCTDGTQDCVLMSYFNSGWWHLTDDNGTLSEAKTEAGKSTSIHLSDLGY